MSLNLLLFYIEVDPMQLFRGNSPHYFSNIRNNVMFNCIQ